VCVCVCVVSGVVWSVDLGVFGTFSDFFLEFSVCSGRFSVAF
jgi:hypothetical protein